LAKNIVVCLDGTNNQLRAAGNTNVVRLFNLLELKDPSKQVAYYDPGVGTFTQGRGHGIITSTTSSVNEAGLTAPWPRAHQVIHLMNTQESFMDNDDYP
jgi:Uncharacterized alpha/beta hydrolase domain (DUF2235)